MKSCRRLEKYCPESMHSAPTEKRRVWPVWVTAKSKLGRVEDLLAASRLSCRGELLLGRCVQPRVYSHENSGRRWVPLLRGTNRSLRHPEGVRSHNGFRNVRYDTSYLKSAAFPSNTACAFSFPECWRAANCFAEPVPKDKKATIANIFGVNAQVLRQARNFQHGVRTADPGTNRSASP